MKEWEYHEPKFECDEINYELLRYSPWSGHRNFAYDFISFFQPYTIVELGSHYGCSAFAFAQAIKDFNLNSCLYAIDTWAGDDFTKNDYNENDVYSVFKKTANKFYSNQKIKMLRMTFDEALNEFDDKSIDVLHIDGSHHYDDVKHDFYSWLPKVKNDGIIFLHDISEDIVLGDIMGSNKFWNEISMEFKNTISFDFSWGLGVIFLSDEMHKGVADKINLLKYQRINNELSVEYRDELRKNYFTLKDNKFHINSLYEQLKSKDYHLNKYDEDISKKNKYIEELEKQIEERDRGLNNYRLNTEAKDNYIGELENSLKAYQLNVEGKDKYIEELKNQIEEKENGLKAYQLNIEGKDRYIEELERKVKDKENFIYELEEKIKKSIFGKFIKK